MATARSAFFTGIATSLTVGSKVMELMSEYCLNGRFCISKGLLTIMIRTNSHIHRAKQSFKLASPKYTV